MGESLNSNIGRSSVAKWRTLLIFAVVAGSIAVIFWQPPIVQEQSYHQFADVRNFLGIPNFGDVASNLGFLIVGIAGLAVCVGRDLGPLRFAWIVMFAGIMLVSIGSSWYHLNPTDGTLVWDRLTMTVGFMGLFVGVLGEYVSHRFAALLWPAVVLGAASVIYWSAFGDLRPYLCVQIIPLLIIPFALAVYRAKYTYQWLLLAGVLVYGAAKLAELGDRAVFSATSGIVSGHSIKHLIAAAGCALVLLSLARRKTMASSAAMPSS